MKESQPPETDGQARPTVEQVLGAARGVLMQASRNGDNRVVVSVPIWGWWGDGKTTSLLTLIGYCDETRHGVAVRLLTDTDDLANLEAERDEYRELNLVGIATATRQDLTEKLTQFLDECQWPRGTDAATPYVFGLSGVVADLGFLYMPDLPGGSYQAAEEAAKAVLGKAHGSIILVDPERYRTGGAEGKQYRDEVHSRLRSCHRAALPTAVLITKGDRKSAKTQVGETFEALTVALEHFGSDQFYLQVVSVLGMDNPTEGDGIPDLPPAAERDPKHLIAAFLWLLSRVFGRPGDAIRATVPAVKMQRIKATSYRGLREEVPELRTLGLFSGVVGELACALPNKAGRTRMLLIDGKEMIELSFAKDAEVHHSREGLGAWTGDPDPDNTSIHYRDGLIFAGARRDTSKLWRGHLGDDLVEEHLPFNLAAWAPHTADRVLGVDAAGRAQLLHLTAAKWVAADYLGDFINEPDLAVLWVNAAGDTLTGFGNGVVAAAKFSATGFGSRLQTGDGLDVTADTTVVNLVGVAAAASEDGDVTMNIEGQNIAAGRAVQASRSAFALAHNHPTVAYVDEDLQLHAAAIVAGKVRLAAPAGDDHLPSAPTSMMWSTDDRFLVAFFGNGTWGIWEAVGVHA